MIDMNVTNPREAMAMRAAALDDLQDAADLMTWLSPSPEALQACAKALDTISRADAVIASVATAESFTPLVWVAGRATQKNRLSAS